jgi:carbon-monoxide dehydrogenase large subunit
MTAVEETPVRTDVVGTKQLRREDPRLLTGESKFVDDLAIAGARFLSMVRSTQAHARVTSIDVTAARAVPGVIDVLTGDDLADAWAAPMPCAWAVTPDMKNPEHYPVARGEVHYVGEIVAVVIAESRYAARDGAGAVVVDYDPLPPVLDLEDAASDRVVVHESLGTNASYTWSLIPDPPAVEAAFAGATHVIKERYLQQRLIPDAMEPRGVAVVPQPVGGDVILYSATQIPHILKIMAGITLGMSEAKVRVIAPAVGGAFGSKLDVYAEELIAVAVARRLGVPTRWNEDRSENGVATIHGRGQVQDIELAADADGRIKAVRVKLLADMGAYLQLVTPGIPLLGAFLYHGVYDVPVYSFQCTGVFTTKTPTDAYRGAGRPEATYAIERAIESLARVVGVSSDEIRRRNYIKPEQFPYTSCAGLVFDSGDYEPTLDRALELVGHGQLLAEQASRRSSGSSKHLGVGMATYVEMCGLAPSRVLASLNYGAGGWESATVRLLPTGKVQVVSGSTPHGQGHETTWSMLIADKFGISPDDVEVLHSDTLISPVGLDTYGSRSVAVGGVAIDQAAQKVLDKAKVIAAHQLEANEDDLEYVSGEFRVRGTPTKSVAIQAIAFAAFTAHDLPDGMEPNLAETAVYDPPNFTFPFGTHVAVVEIDEETGEIRLIDYAAVDDCGNQINPLLVSGQVHGGIVQGVAQALWEEAVYDEDGQLKNPTFLDYLVPSAAELPSFKLDHTVTPSPTNTLGVKGIGEAGTIGSAPAVINAVVDALSHLGITDVAMPATPERLWSMIAAARAKGGGR